ncbi:branched-chain amino acid transport system II carrier protein, partial [Campylobacter upsaliensis]|nr:branched-chain amino acid transport system II carrier protein [Campylobacter upsaliensis]
IQLGQLAGTNFWLALAGFLVTAIGLPFLGILAIGLSGSNGVRELSDRVHPSIRISLFSLSLLNNWTIFCDSSYSYSSICSWD